MDVLFNDATCKTATERANQIDRLLQEVGHAVNPLYSKKIREISLENMRWRVEGSRSSRDSNAPGTLGG
jgi:hypothetical protein